MSSFFVYEVSGVVMAKSCQKLDLYRKVQSARNADSATGRVSDCRNSQIANHLEPFSRPSES
jgi:hypothetical protein